MDEKGSLRLRVNYEVRTPGTSRTHSHSQGPTDQYPGRLVSADVRVCRTEGSRDRPRPTHLPATKVTPDLETRLTVCGRDFPFPTSDTTVPICLRASLRQ